MVHDHHSHKRVAKKVDAISFVDTFAFSMGVLGPVMTLFQSYEIWSTQSAASLSLISWTTYLLMAVSWLWYGVKHKEKLMIVSNSLWLLVHLSVVLGILLY